MFEGRLFRTVLEDIRFLRPEAVSKLPARPKMSLARETGHQTLLAVQLGMR